ncbi:MAG TPA: glutaredoxin family protein [Spongiibacteraceae bacterium]|nr:glutaredoxin family protein [Spongiibacteraceae bacterium]HUH38296.1 glutaredoxin family protein [Spongiibacteraceae bacterium]
MANLILYGTVGCHLCELADVLVSEGIPPGQQLCQRDIADDADLLARYALRIPVLVCEATGRELDWPFDAVQLQVWLRARAGSGKAG